MLVLRFNRNDKPAVTRCDNILLEKFLFATVRRMIQAFRKASLAETIERRISRNSRLAVSFIKPRSSSASLI